MFDAFVITVLAALTALNVVMYAMYHNPWGISGAIFLGILTVFTLVQILTEKKP